jgi:hypothetical protein
MENSRRGEIPQFLGAGQISSAAYIHDYSLMKLFKSSVSNFPLFVRTAMAAAALIATSASAQLVAYDDAGNYLLTANWTNGANQGFGFTPWTIVTNGPNFVGTFVNSGNSPVFVIASVTNVLTTNYTCIWGTFANGTAGLNQTVAFRGFTNSVGTNTFKLQWGSTGAGNQAVTNFGTVHGWCGFSLRTGNDTTQPYDYTDNRFDGTALFYLYFLDGASPSTLYFWDGNGVQSVPNTSFSNLGRNNITNAIEAEVTPGADGQSYHLVLKDCVQNIVLFTTNSLFLSSGTVDSAALFNDETTGDQIYNHMQIAAATNIPPTVSNLQPPDGSLYLDPSATTLSFELDSFNSTVASSTVNVYLNGVLLTGSTFNTASPTSQLLGTNNAVLAPDLFYNYTIVAQDANGNVVSNNFTFNTFLTSDLYIDAGDYNYTNGLFVNSSTPSDAYVNFLGSNTVDYTISDLTGTNNTAGYRPGDLPQLLTLATGATGDPFDHANLRLNGGTAYNLGFTDIGNWENYTRVLPVATNYTIYARAASAASGQFEIEELVNPTATTNNQPLGALGRVNVPLTGGSEVFSGQLIPLTDIYGNTAVVPLAGTKTLRCTAISSRGYNLEYLVVVAVTNATGTLRPYIATGSPVPNATGVGLTSPITFALANRQTSVITNTIQMFLNATNVSSRLIMSSNAVGDTVTWTPTNNLPANYTNTVIVIFTDSASVKVTNTWNFITGTSGGVNGNGFWTGAGGTNDLFWADGINWTGGTPGPGFSATFASQGGTTNFFTNNIVAANVTIQQLNYSTNINGYHTTWIQDGVTLTVTNGSTSTLAALQVGGIPNGDNSFNQMTTNTITGANGTLLVLGNPQGSGSANALNFQVRQNATSACPPNLTTLDLSGLGTLIATVGKFYVAQGGSGANQTNMSGRLYLARTNVITCLRSNAGQFEVGDSSGGGFESPGSTLYLGITNSLFVDTVRFGKQKATNNLICFNPAFTNNAVPAALIRGTNGLTSRVTVFTIADADTEPTAPNYVQANVNFSGGKLDAMVSGMLVGRDTTNVIDTGYALGTLTWTAGTLNVINLTNGCQRANSTATATGIMNLTGTAALISTNIILAQAAAGANPALVSGTLNVTNGTVSGTIVAGGGVSTVNISGGTLVVSNTAGTAAAPLTALNLAGALVHLKVDGNVTTAGVNASAVSASGTTITIDSVANVTVSQTNHLISYTGSDPYAGVSLAPLPSGYTGTLLDNSGSIDLRVAAFVPPPPTIRNIVSTGGQIIIGGTNNSGASGGYSVLSSTNLTLPFASWTLVNTGAFTANGSFSFTNTLGTNSARFYILRVP